MTYWYSIEEIAAVLIVAIGFVVVAAIAFYGLRALDKLVGTGQKPYRTQPPVRRHRSNGLNPEWYPLDAYKAAGYDYDRMMNELSDDMDEDRR